jgi:hypothetical protein
MPIMKCSITHHTTALILLFAVTGISACHKYLEKNPLDQIPSNQFWKTQADAELALTGIYGYLSPGTNATSVGATAPGWGCLTMHWDILADNGYTQSSGGNFAGVSTGVIESTTGGIQADAYNTSYKAIAACNNFLANVDKVAMDTTVKKKYTAEVRFIRAHYYFLLTQLYGDVVLTLQPLGSDAASARQPRTPKSQVVDAILADLEYAVNNLPNTAYTDGHVVRGAALGYKAKVLLTNQRFAEAAAAAQQVISENKFSLYTGGFRGLFLKPTQNNNPEIMFSARYLPPSYAGTTDWVYSYTNSFQVLQYLVDDFECTDGLPITSSPLYNAAKPYDNRDPRLKMTVIVPGDWRGTTAATAFDPARDAVPSGFLVRKYIDSTRYPTTYATQSDQDWVFLRYADILLMYAEAQNEAGGPDASVYAAINAIRARPGVHMPPLPAGLSKSDMQQRIRHERRIELALEGTRYFDLKRWKLDRTIIPAIKDPSGALRTYPLRDTLWPVPQSEIDIANSYGNTGFKQTPGYN